MKSNPSKNISKREPFTGTRTRTPLTAAEPVKQRQQDKEFIKAMNELTAKGGLLSDDPYFGGL